MKGCKIPVFYPPIIDYSYIMSDLCFIFFWPSQWKFYFIEWNTAFTTRQHHYCNFFWFHWIANKTDLFKATISIQSILNLT